MRIKAEKCQWRQLVIEITIETPRKHTASHTGRHTRTITFTAHTNPPRGFSEPAPFKHQKTAPKTCFQVIQGTGPQKDRANHRADGKPIREAAQCS